MRISSFLLMLALGTALVIGPQRAAFPEEDTWRQRPSLSETVTTGDVAAEIEFGREVAARILGRYKTYNNPALVKYVSLVGQSLARSTNRPELEFRFTILDTTEINAYAAPGGYVFLTKGALLLMKDESELAGVLAHEIAHITEKHVVKELNVKGQDDSATSGLARLVGGSSESTRIAFAQAVDKALDILFKDGLKREDEAQADKTAVVISALSGYDSGGLARYLDRISVVKGKTTEVLDKTHPPFNARLALIKETMDSEGMDGSALRTNTERFADATKKLK